MSRRNGSRVWIATWAIIWAAWPVCAQVSSFEDVNLPPDSFWNGNDGGGALVSGSVSFLNNYYPEYASWDGFAASTVHDPTVKGWDGQYNAITGSGLLSSDAYGVYYRGYGDPPRIALGEPSEVQGVYVTNISYAYYALREGDMFTQRFGGDDGHDPDWFMLTVTGLDANETAVGSVDFFLADFRFEDDSRDYVVDQWTFLDLSGLGQVTSLALEMSSSDNGPYGMNTPAYCALDNLVLAPAAPYTDPGIPGFDPLAPGHINPIFRGWAVDWTAYQPARVSQAYADPAQALGPVTGNALDVVSLGEVPESAMDTNTLPGWITLVFGDPNDSHDPRHIRNGAGDDFVVFENGFTSAYSVQTSGSVAGQLLAELAYIEVSTNGRDYVRFPSLSLVDQAVGPYGTLDPNRVTFLAGKHPNGYGLCLGTAFDLEALATCPEVLDGRIDLQDIRFVRVVDIPGSGAFTDSTGHPIYDQWPTTGSGGFDLEAVGVLQEQTYRADINRDGVVDQTDRDALLGQMGSGFGDSGWRARTDLNHDQRTDALDLALLDAQTGSVETWRLAMIN